MLGWFPNVRLDRTNLQNCTPYLENIFCYGYYVIQFSLIFKYSFNKVKIRVLQEELNGLWLEKGFPNNAPIYLLKLEEVRVHPTAVREEPAGPWSRIYPFPRDKKSSIFSWAPKFQYSSAFICLLPSSKSHSAICLFPRKRKETDWAHRSLGLIISEWKLFSYYCDVTLNIISYKGDITFRYIIHIFINTAIHIAGRWLMYADSHSSKQPAVHTCPIEVQLG